MDDGRISGELAGVPIAIKDNLCTSHGTTTCSSKMLKNFHAPYDATVVKKLEDAGAIICRGRRTSMNSRWTRAPMEQRRFKPRAIPGTPPAFPAAVPAAALPQLWQPVCACCSIGSDTGGSIRQPAAACAGIPWGSSFRRMRPRQPVWGLVAFASSLDQIGPAFGWTTPDVALLMNVISGRDPKDSTSVDAPVRRII